MRSLSLYTPILLSFMICSCGPASPDSLRLAGESIAGGHLVTGKNQIAAHTIAIFTLRRTNQSDQYMKAGCTASVLTKRLLVTAAHCLANAEWPAKKPKENPLIIAIQETLFDDDFNDVPRDHISVAEDLRIDADYVGNDFSKSGKTGNHDLALIKLKQDLPEAYSPAKILPMSYKLQTGEFTRAAGFGVRGDAINTMSSDGATFLKYIDYKIGPLNTKERLIHLNGVGATKGIRHGDSGGPAFIQSGDDLLLWGVLSDFPADYIDLRVHSEWLQEKAKELGEELQIER